MCNYIRLDQPYAFRQLLFGELRSSSRSVGKELLLLAALYPEDSSSPLLRGGSLKSSNFHFS